LCIIFIHNVLWGFVNNFFADLREKYCLQDNLETYDPYDIWKTKLGFFVKLLTGFFVLKTLNQFFVKAYINVIAIFVIIISFIFYFPSLFIHGFKEFLFNIALSHPNPEYKESVRGLIIFNLNFGSPHDINIRNSGPFWEPGAFVGYILLAFFFNILRGIKINHIQNIILIIGSITTLSTTGYIALFFLVVFYFFYSKSISKIIFIPGLITVGFILFFTLSFLNQKINDQLIETQKKDLRQDSRNRFSSFIVDIEDLFSSPLVGRGIHEKTRYIDYNRFKISNRNNGDSDFLLKFGVIGFLVYFISIYIGFRKIILFYNFYINGANWGIIFLLIIGFSEGYFLQPFFLTLAQLPWVINWNSFTENTFNV